MTVYYGAAIGGTWSGFIDVWEVTHYDTYTVVGIYYGIYYNAKHEHETKYESFSGAGTNAYHADKNLTIPIGKYSKSAGSYLRFDSALTRYYFSRTHSNYNGYIYMDIKHSGTGAKWKGTSSPYATITIPAVASYSVKYDGNKPSGATANPTNIPSAQTKWFSETLRLSTTRPTIADTRYAFQNWVDTSVSPAHYYGVGGYYSDNRAVTLKAVWDAIYPPSYTVTSEGLAPNTKYRITNKVLGDNAIKGFSGIAVDLSDLTAYYNGITEKTIKNVKLAVGTAQNTVVPQNPTKDSNRNNHYADMTISLSANQLTQSGTFDVNILVTDSDDRETPINCGSVTIVDPTWSETVVVNAPPPSKALGNAVLDKIEVLNYSVYPNVYDTITGNFAVTSEDNDPDNPYWTFKYTFDANHVSDPTSVSPSTSIRLTYKHYDITEKEYRHVFFSTTRNQNYSNGIYNVMFVGGVEENPNYTSRIWWCGTNNPLYFPDTNYLEVGSNDTAVQGLTKAGDYLAVIKQSKTTDTAVFLVFPTSFEETTTYAVKQGVQGVGAIAKYSFNILGDETLFLSPNGVMAIAPSQDDEHKVLNRSYFVDGQLLNEPDIAQSYSFVFDGMYYLSIGNGSVYVLDGNQRNSWGNDKTNLVYECYYLENIPAKCFVKFNDRLVFSTDDDICQFNDGYSDAYDVEDDTLKNVPVKAEWSTILDDDGALHYNKTMQKKGNLVSILPRENETAYKQVSVDEATFNANKTMYFTFTDGKYVRCKQDSVYSSGETYYVENRSNTKVFVKKDDKDPVEIERSFGLSSEIPSEMFLNKKFKKYKRLQFIIRNEEAEAFGVDSIIKNYTVGNYAKK